MDYETKVFGSIAGTFLLGVVFQFLVRLVVVLILCFANVLVCIGVDAALLKTKLKYCTTGLLVVG